MTIALTVFHDQSGDTRHIRFDQEEVVVGRAQGCDVCLDHEAVSLVHFRLAKKGGKLFAIDARATNGTFVDGQRLESAQGVAVVVGAQVAAGPYTVVIADERDQGFLQDTAAFARHMIKDSLDLPSGGWDKRAHLRVVQGPGLGQVCAVPRNGRPVIVGRDLDCDLHLPDADVSRRHLELRLSATRASVRDLGSANGIRLAGERVAGEIVIASGARLALGRTEIVFFDPSESLANMTEGIEDLALAGGDKSPGKPTRGDHHRCDPGPHHQRKHRHPRGDLMLILLGAVILLTGVGLVVYLVV
jgi:pSer/pThr/pTyr-binding forkhead associated (FHA) protein